MPTPSKHLAFTLSELLICLSILGVIASLTLPKVINTLDASQNKAKFKESIALVEEVGAEAYSQGKHNDLRLEYLIARVNTSKVCAINGVIEGCTVIGSIGSEAYEPAIVLHNGVIIGGISRSVGYNQFSLPDGWYIDVNGKSGPNTFGQDVLFIRAPRFSANGTLNPDCSNRRLVCTNNATATTLYNSLFE
jgi:prepilin-type N-terminal cleavage/methylation domain-containing protein